MSYDMGDLLPAAALSTARVVGDYVGPGDEFLELLRNKWPGGYDEADVAFAIRLLSHAGGATLSDSGDLSDFIRIDSRSLIAELRRTGWKESQPALHYFSHFGDDWLHREWSRGTEFKGSVSLDQQKKDASLGKDELSETGIDSSKWTGLPAGFVLTEENRSKLVFLLRQAETKLDEIQITNEDKAQARAYIAAAQALADAPDPPVELIWQLIGRANAIAGIASLFVSILALFT